MLPFGAEHLASSEKGAESSSWGMMLRIQITWLEHIYEEKNQMHMDLSTVPFPANSAKFYLVT